MIHAAAILYDGVVYTLPAPARHPDIFSFMADRIPGITFADGEKGFIDTHMGFLNRADALKRAVLCRQIIGDMPPGGELYSENLW